MLEVLCRNPTICGFFMTYPKAQWQRCLEAVVLLGIASVQAKLGACVLLDQLELEAKKSLPSLSTAVSPLSPSPNRSEYERPSPHQRARHRPLIMYPNLPMPDPRARPIVTLDEDTPRFNLNDTPKSARQLSPKVAVSPRNIAKMGQSGRGKVETPRKLPKYLENVESKIKPQVKKDVNEFKGLLESAKTRKKCGLRKSSSFGDLRQWSESLIGGNVENKENELLIEPNVSLYVMSPTALGRSMLVSEPNTSAIYAHKLKPAAENVPKEGDFLQTTGKFSSKKPMEPHILSLTEQFLGGSTLMEMSNRSYHITDFISTTPMHPPAATGFPEAQRTAPASSSRYTSFAKDYEVRRNDFVRRLSSISSISSVVPEEEQRKSPTPSMFIGTESSKPTPSSAGSFPWMDSYSPNTSFYDREDVRNPMYQDALLSKFL